MNQMNRTTALLPVGDCLTGRRKLTIDEIKAIWAPATVQVMEHEKGKTIFVVGCGMGGYDRELTAHHDQTGRRLGRLTQFGEVQINAEKRTHFTMVLKGREIPKSAPVWVYK